jgi:ParB family transcriptional regulator, chromosome partitioning protein
MKKKNATTPQILIKRIVLNPEQPRQLFEPTELEELAGSIREHGVIVPIAVEECGDDYILHDGERRLRAAKLAGLTVIPAIVSPPLNGTGPRERLERALVANVQRSNMHIVEEGYAYQRMITEFGYNVQGVARRVGKHYSWVHKCVSLVTQLEPEILQLMLAKKLPSSDNRVLPAFLSVPAGEERIALARALAEHKATARMVVENCKRYNRAKADSAQRNRKKKEQQELAEEPTLAVKEVSRALPEWDALYQLGKVPPWPVVTEAVMKTCDSCPIRSMASPTVCGECALVSGLRLMLEAVHVC